MMFKLSLIALLVGALVLVHADNIDKDAQIVSEQSEPADPEGNYRFAFQTTNGIQSQEAGNANGVTGTSEYVAPDGSRIVLSYVADENGFQPQGDHLPTPPPIPEAIIRALEYIAAHPAQQK